MAPAARIRRWNIPAIIGIPIRLAMENHAVPETGVMMYVRNESRRRIPAEAIWSVDTVLLAGRNFIDETIGPPKNDSIHEGT